jgi:hypothetical protein
MIVNLNVARQVFTLFDDSGGSYVDPAASNYHKNYSQKNNPNPPRNPRWMSLWVEEEK